MLGKIVCLLGLINGCQAQPFNAQAAQPGAAPQQPEPVLVCRSSAVIGTTTKTTLIDSVGEILNGSSAKLETLVITDTNTGEVLFDHQRGVGSLELTALDQEIKISGDICSEVA